MSLSPRAFAPFFIAMLCLLAPSAAFAGNGTGGVAYEEEPAPPPMEDPGKWSGKEVRGTVAKLLSDGTAAAPRSAPEQVKQAIWAANSLQDLPYVYGGGHSLTFKGKGYDCSGTVSFALHGGDLLDSPLDSGSFMRWGRSGRGRWITVYTNPGHAYVVIAGLRLDTSSAGMSRTARAARRIPASAFERGPRWRPMPRSARGYVARHPVSF